MSNEEKLNEGLSELYEKVANTLPRRTNRALQVISDVRLLISDIIANHIGSEGIVPKSEIPNVIREVRELESRLYTNLNREIRQSISDTAETSALSITEVVVGVFGVTTLAGIAGITATNAMSNEAIFGALVGSGILSFISSIVDSITNRRGEDDGKQLTQRIRVLARMMLRRMEDTLRTSIANGEDTSSILRKLNRVINANKSHVRKIVDTESMVTVRNSVAKFAETSGMVAALKIIDFPHGHAHVHHTHKCYIYSEADEHGMGKGIYPVSTRKIRNPHPQCRSMLTYVLKPEFEEGG